MTMFPKAKRYGDTIYTSGLAAIDPATWKPTSPDFATQCAEVLDQLDAELVAHRSDRESVLKLECFLADRAYYAAWNAAFGEFFSSSAPARTTTITTLPAAGLLIEIQAIAATSKGSRIR